MEILRIVFTQNVYQKCARSSALPTPTQGLGSIAGMADTYWGKNKGRSMEGAMVKATKIMGILFFVLALVLNLNF